jgi:hypothetical protein
MHGKTRWLAAGVVVLLVAAVPAVALGQGRLHRSTVQHGSHTPRQGEWRGGTSQGARVIFDVLNTRKGLMWQGMYVELDATCGDNSIGFVVSGFKRPIKPNGNFQLNLYDPFFGSFDFHGKLFATHGGGFGTVTIPSLNKDGTTTACSSGTVAWKAQAPASSAQSGSSAATRHLNYLVHVTQSKSGHVSWTVDKG